MSTTQFSDFSLNPSTLKALEDMGFSTPSPIQAQAIPAILEGKDIMGQSQTGTGKTGAFVIPSLNHVDSSSRDIQMLIMCPTRELAIQVAEETMKIGRHHKGLITLPVYGGQHITHQIKMLKKGVHIVVGTPGRILDLMRREILDVSHVKVLVLDEADRMLDMGFQEDMEEIMDAVPKVRQTLFFSATFPREIADLARRYLNDPFKISITPERLTVSGIKQTHLYVQGRDKREVLSRIIDIHGYTLGIIFCNTKREVDTLVEHLQQKGYSADALHGDLKQLMRDRVMKKFKTGKTAFLIATDVAARGLDVDDVEVVINYDLPQDSEDYVHRIGRTGRKGKEGRSFSFVTPKEKWKLKDIERSIKSQIPEERVPTREDASEARSQKFVTSIATLLEKGPKPASMALVERLFEQGNSYERIAEAAFSLLLEQTNEKSQESTSSSDGTKRFFMNIGKKDGIRIGDIVGALAGECGIPGNSIGNIEMHHAYTFLTIEEEYVDVVLAKVPSIAIRGNRFTMEPAENAPSSSRDEGYEGREGGGSRRGRGSSQRRQGGFRRDRGGYSGGGRQDNRGGGRGNSTWRSRGQSNNDNI